MLKTVVYGLAAVCVAVICLVAGCGGADTPTPGVADSATATHVPVPTPAMPEMEIDGIRTSQAGPFVQLSEKAGGRILPIWIGLLEARAIALKLEEIPLSRPMTQDLLDSIIARLGGRVAHVIVTDLLEGTFYAKIVIQVNGDVKEIDSRPSDAMALAVRTQVPIFSDESVMEKAAILLDKETGKPIPLEGQSQGEGVELKEEELRRMSAFTDFINNDLDLEDFGRQQSGGS